MAVNRFDQYYQPQYTPEPLDQLLAVGMQKRQDLFQNVQNMAQVGSMLGNIPSVGVADTNKKNEILKKAEDQINGIVKSGKRLDDPLISYQINGLVNGVMSNPDIQKIIGDYQLYQSYLGNVEKLKTEGKYAESHDFPVASKWNSFLNDPNYNPSPVMRSYTTIDQPSDYRKKVMDLFNQAKANGTIKEGTDGKWIWKISNEVLNPNDLIAWGLNQGFLTQNDIKSLRYDAAYQYEGLTDESKQKITPKDYEDLYYANTLASMASFYGYQKTGREMKDDPYSLQKSGYDLEHDKSMVPSYAPAVQSPTKPHKFKIDSDGTVTIGEADVNEMRKEQLTYLTQLPLGVGLPLAFLNRARYALGLDKEEVDPNKLPVVDRMYFEDAKAKVQKIRQDQGEPPLEGKNLNVAIKNYLKTAGENANTLGNPVINQYTTPEQINKASDTYFIPGEGDQKGKTTFQGTYAGRRFYSPDQNGAPLSGDQWIKRYGKGVQPKVLGEFGPDNPFVSYGMPVQTSDGKYHWMEGNLIETRNPINNFAHEVYLAKWNYDTNSNYFPVTLGGKEYLGGANYDPETNTYDFNLYDKSNGNYVGNSSVAVGSGGTFNTPEELAANIILHQDTYAKNLK